MSCQLVRGELEPMKTKRNWLWLPFLTALPILLLVLVSLQMVLQDEPNLQVGMTSTDVKNQFTGARRLPGPGGGSEDHDFSADVWYPAPDCLGNREEVTVFYDECGHVEKWERKRLPRTWPTWLDLRPKP